MCEDFFPCIATFFAVGFGGVLGVGFGLALPTMLLALVGAAIGKRD